MFPWRLNGFDWTKAALKEGEMEIETPGGEGGEGEDAAVGEPSPENTVASSGRQALEGQVCLRACLCQCQLG